LRERTLSLKYNTLFKIYDSMARRGLRGLRGPISGL
jgi:hypothetical protein